MVSRKVFSKANYQWEFIKNWELNVTKSLSKKKDYSFIYLFIFIYLWESFVEIAVRFQSEPCICLTQQFTVLTKPNF